MGASRVGGQAMYASASPHPRIEKNKPKVKKEEKIYQILIAKIKIVF
jgi:hypothetical protein